MDNKRFHLQAYSLSESFKDEHSGQLQKRVIDLHGKACLDQTLWSAGDLAYQFLKIHFPDGINESEYSTWVKETIGNPP